MNDYVVVIESVEALRFVGTLDPAVEVAMIRALNKTADRTRTTADKRIRSQVNFPASYLRPSEKRLWVATKAGRGSLEAIVRGRGRPTSLARFAAKNTPKPGPTRPKNGEISVEVKPGIKHKIPRAFLINLKGSPESANLGLAVRTNGGRPQGAYAPKELTRLGKNLWLLYGPSIDQVLYSARNAGGVVEEIAPETLSFLNREFLRLMDLELK